MQAIVSTLAVIGGITVILLGCRLAIAIEDFLSQRAGPDWREADFSEARRRQNGGRR